MEEQTVMKLDESTGRLVMTWDAFEVLTQRLADALKERKLTGVYGFPRGGLVLAVKLSHMLNLPLLMAPAKGCVICDDISDSGETIAKYVTSASYVTATLLMREGTKAIPAYIGERITIPNWIEFPWEA